MLSAGLVILILKIAVVAVTVVTLLWMIYGYSLIFTEHNGFIGGMSKFMLNGVGIASQSGTAPAVIPETIYIMFQLTFGILPRMVVASPRPPPQFLIPALSQIGCPQKVFVLRGRSVIFDLCAR